MIKILRPLLVLVLVLTASSAFAGGFTIGAPGGVPAKMYIQPSFSNPAFGLQFLGGSAAISKNGTGITSGLFGGAMFAPKPVFTPFSVPPPVQYRTPPFSNTPIWKLPIWR